KLREEEKRMQIEQRYHSYRAENLWLHMERQFNQSIAASGVRGAGAKSVAGGAGNFGAKPEGAVVGGEGQKTDICLAVIICNSDLPQLTRDELLANLSTIIQAAAQFGSSFGILRNYRSNNKLILLHFEDEGSRMEIRSIMAQAESVLESKLSGISLDSVVSYASACSPEGADAIMELYDRCLNILKGRFLRRRRGYFETDTGAGTHSAASVEVISAEKRINEEFARVQLCFKDSMRDQPQVKMETVRRSLEGIFAYESFGALPIDRLQSAFDTLAGLIAGEDAWIARRTGAGGADTKAADDRDTAASRAVSRDLSLDHFDAIADVIAFFDELVRNLYSTGDTGGNFRQYRRRIIDYIKMRYHEPLTLMQAASHFAFHPNYFSGAFHRVMGCSFMDYLTKLRVDESKALLLDSSLSIHRISEKVGYNSQSYFQKVFKKAEGMTPMEFREANKPIHNS
ncbi:MAG: AraC family transcriptional regulator, partial [Clostridiales bacterium]|nr:AraC family transcriptional regulator [Clostridiales bacterium]